MIINHNSPTALNRINDKRSLDVASGFYWSPKATRFDTDNHSLFLVAGRAVKIHTKKYFGDIMSDFYWRDSSNNNILFTPDEFLLFAVALDDWVEAAYVESWERKPKV